jgi:hypothetical protein
LLLINSTDYKEKLEAFTTFPAASGSGYNYFHFVLQTINKSWKLSLFSPQPAAAATIIFILFS